MTTANAATPEVCIHRIWKDFHHYQCGKKAKANRNGKPYCGTHDPVKRAEKVAKRTAAFDVQWAASEKKRWLEASAPQLLEALKELVKARWMVSVDWAPTADYDAVMDKANEAIKTAEGSKP